VVDVGAFEADRRERYRYAVFREAGGRCVGAGIAREEVIERAILLDDDDDVLDVLADPSDRRTGVV